MKHIVALGSSNFQKLGGIREAFLREDVNFTNLSLAGMGAASKIHILKRDKNQKVLQNADLIIIESNLIENTDKIPVEISIRNTHWLFEELYFLNKKILILILPLNSTERVDRTNLVYEKLSCKYGFNLINMQKVYKELNVLEFWQDKIDPFHEIDSIMHAIGQNIIDNLDKMQMPKKLEFTRQNPEFKIYKAYEMQGAEEIFVKRNFFHNEKVVRLKETQRLYFNEGADGFYLFTIGTCSIGKTKSRDIFKDVVATYSSVIFHNLEQEFVKAVGFIHEINEIWHKFKLDKHSFITMNNENKPWSEASRHTGLRDNSYSILNYTDITEIMLVKGGEWDFRGFDYESIEDKNFKPYNFNHLVPDMGFLTEVVKQFNERKDPLKLRLLQSENTNLKAQVTDLTLHGNLRYSAIARVRNHLAYRLGAAIIVCNKSFFGICSLPFVLSFIKAQYKKEQAAYQSLIKQRPELKLPALENYADYQTALKEKECFTYKLGEAMMRADKTWLSGGYIKFYFEAKKLEREFKNNKG